MGKRGLLFSISILKVVWIFFSVKVLKKYVYIFVGIWLNIIDVSFLNIVTLCRSDPVSLFWGNCFISGLALIWDVFFSFIYIYLTCKKNLSKSSLVILDYKWCLFLLKHEHFLQVCSNDQYVLLHMLWFKLIIQLFGKKKIIHMHNNYSSEDYHY